MDVTLQGSGLFNPGPRELLCLQVLDASLLDPELNQMIELQSSECHQVWQRSGNEAFI